MANKTAIYLMAGSENKLSSENTFTLESLSMRGISVERYTINTRNLMSGLLFTFFLSIRKRPDIVIAFEYYCTFFACLTFGARRSVLVISIGMNQSRRLLNFRSRMLNAIVNRIFRRLKLIVVHSQAEAEQFSILHEIPKKRFAFCHWGYDLPAFSTKGQQSAFDAPVCMIGRNNRDYDAFIGASNRVGFLGRIVAPAYSRLTAQPGKKVDALFDIPMGECIAHMSAAKVNVVALVDASRGAGHITIVSAMHLGRAQVVSDASQIADYIIDGFNGLIVPIGDNLALANAISQLLRDPALATHLGENGREISERFMSYEAYIRRINSVVEACLSEEDFCFVDPAWAERRQQIAQDNIRN